MQRSFVGYVYMLKCNEGLYIGLTSDSVDNRWKGHIRAANQDSCRKRKIVRAIRTHGPLNMERSVIEEVTSDTFEGMLRKLAERESYHIDQLDTFHNGLNGRPGMSPEAIDSWVRHMVRSMIYHCPHCTRRYSVHNYFLYHLRQEHPDSPERLLVHPCKFYRKEGCARCFRWEEDRREHYVKDHGERCFPCKSCSESYDNEKGLRIHRNVIHGDERIKKTTPTCPPTSKRIRPEKTVQEQVDTEPCFQSRQSEKDTTSVVSPFLTIEDEDCTGWTEWFIEHNIK